MNIENITKLPMNYTGGKYRLLKQIFPLFPDKIEGMFVDVFCGGGDIAINVNNCEKIVANDINTKVIEIYRKMQNITIEELLSYIEEKIKEYSLTIENVEGYNNFRKYYNNSITKNPIDLFIYFNLL